jgi:hypothetical protein
MTKVSDLSFKKSIFRVEITFTFEQKKYQIKVPNLLLQQNSTKVI